MACPHCGSWAVRSDRALAGRMVCARCGQPLGGGAGSRAGGRRRSSKLALSGRQRLGLALLGLLLVSAVLAGLDQRSGRVQRAPAWQTGSPWSL
jgi:DNA-directed RNA polymerase subunit RPC12/RpoP